MIQDILGYYNSRRHHSVILSCSESHFILMSAYALDMSHTRFSGYVEYDIFVVSFDRV